MAEEPLTLPHVKHWPSSRNRRRWLRDPAWKSAGRGCGADPPVRHSREGPACRSPQRAGPRSGPARGRAGLLPPHRVSTRVRGDRSGAAPQVPRGPPQPGREPLLRAPRGRRCPARTWSGSEEPRSYLEAAPPQSQEGSGRIRRDGTGRDGAAAPQRPWDAAGSGHGFREGSEGPFRYRRGQPGRWVTGGGRRVPPYPQPAWGEPGARRFPPRRPGPWGVRRDGAFPFYPPGPARRGFGGARGPRPAVRGLLLAFQTGRRLERCRRRSGDSLCTSATWSTRRRRGERGQGAVGPGMGGGGGYAGVRGAGSAVTCALLRWEMTRAGFSSRR